MRPSPPPFRPRLDLITYVEAYGKKFRERRRWLWRIARWRASAHLPSFLIPSKENQ